MKAYMEFDQRRWREAIHAGWTDLLSGRRHAELFRLQRARFIASRMRAVALLFTFLTVAWIPIDLLTAPAPCWPGLTGARVGAALAFALLARRGRAAPILRSSLLQLGILFLVPIAFFTFAWWLFRNVGNVLFAGHPGLILGYGLLPFVLMAGIALFPLALVEGSALALLTFLATGLIWAGPLALDWLGAGSNMWFLWVLAVVGAVSVLAAASQLDFMHRLFERLALDPTTRFLNRPHGEQLLAYYWETAHHEEAPLALAFLKLEGITALTARLGQAVSEELLRRFATQINHPLPPWNMGIRWDSDTLALLLPGYDRVATDDWIKQLGNRLQGLRPDGQPFGFTTGIAVWPEDPAVDWKEWVALARQRLLSAAEPQ